jgi:ABC-type multidrug transport system fused ATPase/permease subunit
MINQNRELIKFILKLISNKTSFVLWFFVRFISAFLPLLSIYLYSQTINLIENKSDFSSIIFLCLFILFIHTLDNFTRLLSISKLQNIFSNTEFNIHRFFMIGLRSKDKNIRHEAIQSIRNFAESVRLTLQMLRQPGVDSIVSLLVIPCILFLLDFRVFIIYIAYVVTYSWIDFHTTEKYSKLKNVQNLRTERYYGKFQETNDVVLEEKRYALQFKKLCVWYFKEWFSLQSIAVTFYSIILFYLVFSVSIGVKSISSLILIMGYITQTQKHLNSFSNVKDRLADVRVALIRLSKSKKALNIDISDLVR